MLLSIRRWLQLTPAKPGPSRAIVRGIGAIIMLLLLLVAFAIFMGGLVIHSVPSTVIGAVSVLAVCTGLI